MEHMSRGLKMEYDSSSLNFRVDDKQQKKNEKAYSLIKLFYELSGTARSNRMKRHDMGNCHKSRQQDKLNQHF
ncbi:CLUMA_CG007881, isoform A [Clunio marinus]|uniref:CLUMA_CG007881, isoform A n=1 Tax=Clunio marinus TaxID=568069 RepID=A0A1J1I219_9DIPT|nr:CLUMA_CG007881, isoform A [Clunio marinus]